MSFKLGKRSKENLEGVHPDLVAIVEEVLKTYDISIIDGLRTVEEQKELVANGVSRTMNSMHLEQPDGYGHAIDVIAYPFNGWEDKEQFNLTATHMLAAANRLGINLEWGGHWKSFFDAPHYQLRRS